MHDLPHSPAGFGSSEDATSMDANIVMASSCAGLSTGLVFVLITIALSAGAALALTAGTILDSSNDSPRE